MEFRILGPLQVVAAGRPVALGGLRHERILAALVLASGHPVSSGRLSEIAYDDVPDATRRQLQNRISALRALLSRAGGVPPGGELIARQGDGYVLRATRDQVDAFRFDDLTTQARGLAAAGDRVRAARLLRKALALWRGPALDGLDCDPLHRQVAGLDEARLGALEDCLHLELATEANPGSLVPELRSLVAAHPLRQRLTSQLMTALYHDGRQADALTVYRDLAARVAEAHGLDLYADLQDLHRAILRDELPRPAGTAGTAPAQLPLDVRGFVGRAAQLDALDRIAEAQCGQPTAVVVSAVWGAAGVGKTALAVHWAQRARTRFPDGQLYVNLRGFDPTGAAMTPAEAVRGFLAALGVPAERIPVDFDAQVALYRTLLADRRVLVVLDNARDADQVRRLLPGAPGCLVLITSRNRLAGLVAVEGAHPVPLDLLEPDEARDLLASRIGAHRVAAEPEAVNEVIARCGRLPLALAIVAARAAVYPDLPLAALAGELSHAGTRLDALTTGDPAADIRAVLSWSYRTLGSETARLFRLLGLLPGPDVAVPAAASLVGLPRQQAAAMLAELAGGHLIVDHSPGRYGFHDLLRAYADALASEVETPGQRGAAVGRLLDHYLHTAHTAARLLYPARDPITLAPPRPGVIPETLADLDEAASWFVAEHSVLLSAVEQAAAGGLDSHAWQLAWTLTVPLQRRGLWHDQADVQRVALAATQRLGDPDAQARAHRLLGLAYRQLGRHDDSRAEFRQALDLYRQVGDPTGQAHTRLGIAVTLERQGRYTEAFHNTQQALDLFRAAGHRGGEATALNAVGWLHVRLDKHEAAVSCCRRAITLHQEVGNRDGEAKTWDSLGYAHHHLGQHPEAVACYTRALDLYREIGELYYEAVGLTHLGDTHLGAGEAAAARQAWEDALAILTELGHHEAEPLRAKLHRLASPAT